MAKSPLNTKKERGSSDELAILQEIIKDNPHLLDRVLTRIRDHRSAGKQGISEMVSQKTGAKKEEERQRGSGT
ncbi:MAG: hypothetical protein NTX25_04635 [Proteobacteria bacterium]|nr:hypothetical protein [Pseudomonadota bacterium]